MSFYNKSDKGSNLPTSKLSSPNRQSGSSFQAVNKVIYLSSTGTGSPSGPMYANVNIEFPVKEILIKQIICNTSDSSINFGLLYSELVQNNILGITYINPAAQSNYEQNIRYAYKTPQLISGSYSFQLRDATGTPLTLTDSDSYDIAVVIEFIEYRTDIANVDI